MAELLIREVTPEDLPRLREIFLHSRRATFRWIDPASYQLTDFEKETEGEVLLLAELEGVVAGFISWWAPESFIHHLFIDGAYHRRGIGKALLDACLARLPGPATLKCQARNRNALAFYQALGWRIIETIPRDRGDYHLMQSPDSH